MAAEIVIAFEFGNIVRRFFHFFVNNLQFCCKISGLVENVFHLAELGGAVLIYWIP